MLYCTYVAIWVTFDIRTIGGSGGSDGSNIGIIAGIIGGIVAVIVVIIIVIIVACHKKKGIAAKPNG